MYPLELPWANAHSVPGSTWRSEVTHKQEKAVGLRTWGGCEQPGRVGDSLVQCVVSLPQTAHLHGHPVLLPGVHTIC